jgi:hypothetical protein
MTRTRLPFSEGWRERHVALASGPVVERWKAYGFRALPWVPVRIRALFCCVAAWALSGCDRIQELTKQVQGAPEEPALPSSAPSASVSPLHPDGGAPAIPLDPKVRRAMRLAPLKRHEPGLAIGKGRIAALAPDALVVRDSTKFEEIVRIPLMEPRILTVMADGSFLAADELHAVWLLPHDTKARKLPKIVMLPGSAVFADRRTPDRFWVLPGFGHTLYAYSVARSTAGILVADEWISLDDFDGQALGSLRDGSFLYTIPAGFRQFYGPTKKEDVAGDAHDVVRILPASRPDTLWVVQPTSAGLYRLLAGKLVRLRSIPFETMPYDVEAEGPYLAVLELLQPSDAPWSFVLEVFDIDGKRRVHESFPAEESLDSKTWLATMNRDRHLSLSFDPPLVAVGGPGSLTVFRADTGTRVTPKP